ncbi:hypothetical protein FACS189415_3340 [Bacteroidia bacterium]|nr:hypothetical protein FACS189415_3340 [Bacteroidia bacterium]
MKNNFLAYSSLFLLALGGLLVLGTVFAANASLANGIVMGKLFWFHLAMAMFALGTIFYALTNRKIHYIFSLPDVVILFSAGIVWLTYDRLLNPEPDKLLFAVQLVLLWFMLRVALTAFPALKPLFLFFILCTGLIEAIWGIEQLYGYKASTHHLFRLTGSFYNPGPYSGYIAVVLPIALSLIVGKDKKPTLLYWFGWVCLAAILVVLPAGMSRSAWVAAAVGCVYVGLPTDWLKMAWEKHSKWVIVALVVVILCLTIGLAGLYHLKKDSADGRLLMWKITGKAMLAHPLGVGLGGFPAAYAAMQAEYFSSGQASDTEKLVAGGPEYAFNEYLQIGVEQGIAGLTLFLLWIGFGLRRKENRGVTRKGN